MQIRIFWQEHPRNIDVPISLETEPEQDFLFDMFRHVPRRRKFKKNARNKCSNNYVPKRRYREPRGAERNTTHPRGWCVRPPTHAQLLSLSVQTPAPARSAKQPGRLVQGLGAMRSGRVQQCALASTGREIYCGIIELGQPSRRLLKQQRGRPFPMGRSGNPREHPLRPRRAQPEGAVRKLRTTL